MTIDKDIYIKIRELERQGLSQRKISGKLGICRQTVKRYFLGAHYPGEELETERNVSKTKQEKMEIAKEVYLEETFGATRKQKPSCVQIYKNNQDKLDIMGGSTFRRYIHDLELNKDKKFYIPLAFAPGEVAQVDWVQAKVNILGETETFNVFCFVLAYSNRSYAQIMPNMTFTNFAIGHVLAFESISGVPERIFYDNLKTAVLKDHGKNAVTQDDFKLFAAHYGFIPEFMNIASGNEKGKVENLCKIVQQMLSPIPKVDSLSQAQDIIISKMEEYNDTHKIKGKKKSIKEFFEEEKGQLRHLPLSPYSPYEGKIVTINSELLFTVDTNQYSVPHKFVNTKVSIRIYPYKIEVLSNGNIVAKHKRCLGKKEYILEIDHYMVGLKVKIRAHNNALPLLIGNSSYDEIIKFREKCCDRKNIGKQLMKIYTLMDHYPINIVLDAVSYANQQKNIDISEILKYIKLVNAGQNLNINHNLIKLHDYDSLIPSIQDDQENNEDNKEVKDEKK
jgi:transposase